MNNEELLRRQLAAANLRPTLILHNRGCVAPCACDCRAVVVIRERANTRLGYRERRHIVRVNPNATIPEPFKLPTPEPQPTLAPKQRETIIQVLPVNGSAPEPQRSKKRKNKK